MSDFYRAMYYSMLRVDTAIFVKAGNFKWLSVLSSVVRNANKIDDFLDKYGIKGV